MITFDGWETELYGDVLALPRQSSEELQHFRTKGSKNGVRRYQTASGEWTPLGLKERAAREGWNLSIRSKMAKDYARNAKAEARELKRGAKRSLNVYKKNKKAGLVSDEDDKFIKSHLKEDRKNLKNEISMLNNRAKASRLESRILKNAERSQRFTEMKKVFKDRKNKDSLKNLSDEELQRRINRIKKEMEYKELTKNPIIKQAESIVNSYLKAKSDKLDREMKKAELIVRQQEAKTKLIAAKAANTAAKNNLIDTLTNGAKRKQAKTQLINAKADKTIRGAVRTALGGVIKKEGERIVNGMSKDSAVLRGGKSVKNAASKSRDWAVSRVKSAIAQDNTKAEKKKKAKTRKLGEQLRG